MTKEEQENVLKCFDEFYNILNRAKQKIKSSNYGLAYEVLSKDLPSLEIRVDQADAYKPVGVDTKKSLIEKGIEWLDKNFMLHDHSSGRGEWFEINTMKFDSMGDMFEDFRKTMEV